MRLSPPGRLYEQFLLRVLIGLVPGPLLAGSGCDHENGPAGQDTAPALAGAAAVSAEIAVTLPEERPVSGRWPAAAFDGTRYLVVWEDLRAGRPILYGARVGADGAALDPLGFPLLDALQDETIGCCEYEPTVAAGDGNFLVVSEVAGQILGVRVSGTGEVLDPDGIAIATAAGQASRPALVFDGEQYMVAWAQGASDASPDGGVYWARVQTDGTVLDPGGVRGDALARAPGPVGLSFDGTSHLLSWVDWLVEPETTAVYGARIAPDGARIDADAIPISPAGMDLGYEGPVSSFDGTNHVILWNGRFVDDASYSILVMASRVTPGRTVLDPDGIEIDRHELGILRLDRLAIAAGAGRSVVTWSRDALPDSEPVDEPIGAAVVAANGAVSPHPASAFASGVQATLAAHADGALLLWRDRTAAFPDDPVVMGARLDETGVPGTSGAVAPGFTARSQRVSGVASDGHTYFVVWTDARGPEDGERGLYGARIAADGTPLDPEGIRISTEPVHRAGVVFDGASFLVTWVQYSVEGGPTKAVHVSPDGALLDTEPLLMPRSWEPLDLAAASDGTHTLVAGPSDPDSYLGAVLLDQDGKAASEVVHPLVDGRRVLAISSAVSFDGAGYLVVWHGYETVFGQRVDALGSLLGESFVIAGEVETTACTRAASGGGNHLVVWHDGNGSILATRVSPAGEVLDAAGRLITAAADASETNCPAVAFDGERFVVAWRAPSAVDESAMDLYGAEVGPDGEVLGQFTISDDPESEGRAFLAAGEDGQVLAAYDRFVPGLPYETQRAQARLLAPGVVPGPGPDAGPPGPAPDAGGSPVEPPGPPGGDDGCGCRVGADQPAPVAMLVLFGVVALSLVRRRGVR
jgi:MYXO-CTERM domain-containing protein